MSDSDGQHVSLYEMRISYVIDGETGEPLVGLHEDGDLELITKLGLLRMTEDTLLADLGDDDD